MSPSLKFHFTHDKSLVNIDADLIVSFAGALVQAPFMELGF